RRHRGSRQRRRAHAHRGRRAGFRQRAGARADRGALRPRVRRPGPEAGRSPLGGRGRRSLGRSKAHVDGPTRPATLGLDVRGTWPARKGPARRRRPTAEAPAQPGRLHHVAGARFEKLSDAELSGKTAEFRQRIENGEPVDELVFDSFAAVREAFKRTMGIRLFDVQLMGGIVLHEGDIAETRTGEGKTLVAVQPLYLNALDGRSVNLVTANDYLAKRDPEWTKP